MMTSCFARLQQIPRVMEPVAISRGLPKWYTGRVEERLAPTWAMLRLPPEEFDRRYAEHLERLNPWELYKSLGPNAVLLCWEAPGYRCHRRMVAEWFERHLGITVTELGFPRSIVPRYADMPLKTKEEAPAQEPPQGKVSTDEPPPFRQGVLFPW